jgi:hypothetical protein
VPSGIRSAGKLESEGTSDQGVLVARRRANVTPS